MGVFTGTLLGAEGEREQGSDPEGGKPLEKPLEKPPENPLEISYTGRSPKIGS